MIEFVNGPNKEALPSKEEQKQLIHALKHCDHQQSTYFWLNMIYNNYYHFSNPSYAYYTPIFLQEIAKVARSRDSKIVVMGGQHSDTGHTSGLVLFQSNSLQEPCFVEDTYIRFTVKLSPSYKSTILNDVNVFHFLTNVPKVTYPLNKRGTVIVHNIPTWMDDKVAQSYLVSAGKLRVQRGMR